MDHDNVTFPWSPSRTALWSPVQSGDIVDLSPGLGTPRCPLESKASLLRSGGRVLISILEPVNRYKVCRKHRI